LPPDGSHSKLWAYLQLRKFALDKFNRRLSDRIIDAFDHACSSEDLEVAEGLFRVLELVLTRHGENDSADKRKNIAFVLEAADKLQLIREVKDIG